MSRISEIQEIASDLNLQNISKGMVDLSNSSSEELDYLKFVLGKEQELRNINRRIRNTQESHLPKNKAFVKERINKGLLWQIEKLEKLDWIDNEQNIIVIGNCGTGKTSLVCHLGTKALCEGHKVSYATVDNFLYTIKNKDKISKQDSRYRHMLSSSLIIIDDMMYAGISDEDLMLFYHAIILLNETRSIVIVTNRELSEWKQGRNDLHLMTTLIERLTPNSQLIRIE